MTYITEVPIEHLDISMYSLQRDQLVVAGRNGADEEERGISSVNDFRVWRISLGSFRTPSTLRLTTGASLLDGHLLMCR